MAQGTVIQGYFRGGRAPVLQTRAAGSSVQAKAPLPFAATGGKPVAATGPRVVAAPPVRFPGQKPAPAQAKPVAAPKGKAPLPFAAPCPKPAVQAKPAAVAPHVVQLRGGEAFAVPSSLNLSNPGGGRPLPAPVREKMESFFGTTFSDVRVHVGNQAPSIGALAFTHGSNLYFAPGQYNPGTTHGQQLLGHELTHVVQQRAGRVKNPFGSGVAVVQDRAMEAEADRLGQRAAAHTVTVQAKQPPAARATSVARSFVRVVARSAARPIPVCGAVQRSAPLKVSGLMPVGNGSYRIVAGAGGQQVGSVMVHNHGESALEVTDLAVDPAHRKQGLGGVLMASAMRAGLQMRKAKVTLASQDDGTGRLTAWYKNMGFAQVGSNDLGYPVLEAPISRALSGVAQRKQVFPPPQTQVQRPKTASANSYFQSRMQGFLSAPMARTPAPGAFASPKMSKNIQRMRGGSGKHQATATAPGKKPVTAFSGNGGALKYALSQGGRWSESRKLYSILESVVNVRGGNPWHAFDCAEPNVVGELVLAGAKLEEIIITRIEQGGNNRRPCKNCRQWLRPCLGGWQVRDVPVHPVSNTVAPVVGAAVPGNRVNTQRPRVSMRELGKKMNIFEFLSSDETRVNAAFDEAEDIAESRGKQL